MGDAKVKLGMAVPVGTKFHFKWKVEKGTTKLENLTDFPIDKFKTLLEGEYSEKKWGFRPKGLPPSDQAVRPIAYESRRSQ